jgi:hypothetical protein
MESTVTGTARFRAFKICCKIDSKSAGRMTSKVKTDKGPPKNGKFIDGSLTTSHFRYLNGLIISKPQGLKSASLAVAIGTPKALAVARINRSSV